MSELRSILHVDMNCFYASVEMLHHPAWRDVPMAVGGDPEARHGIVLTANYPAKRLGVKTGMALWQARQVCPQLVFAPPHMDQYMRFSRLARQIYAEYSDTLEPYGLDESWIDVTHSTSCKGDARLIANEISNRVKSELGLTVSIGVSWDKIYAKFGSDYKKPDAITVIDRDNYKDIVWKKPASDLLFVGRATDRKLKSYGIHTIGELAETDPEFLHRAFGKMGYVLYAFANGQDQTPVANENYKAPIKSIGNSTTTPRDLVCEQDVRIIMFLLAESVSARLKENGFKCRGVEISVRDKDLFSYTKQQKIETPTDISQEIASAAVSLFCKSYRWNKPLRSIGVRAIDLVDATYPTQFTLFQDENQREKQRQVDIAVNTIRRRFGFDSIQRGLMYQDRILSHLNPKEQTVHPHGYFENGNHTGAGRMLLS